MILPEQSPTAIQSKENEALEDVISVPNEPPPSYSSSGSTVQMQRSNFIAVSRSTNCVKGAYLLDATMDVPRSLLPPLPEGEETYKNLRLNSTYSYVQGEVTILPVDTKGERVTLSTTSSHSSVNITVHRPAAYPAFHLDASSGTSYVSVRIPRSFHGPITAVTSYGSVKISDEVLRNQTFMSDVEQYRCFIGDLGDYGKDPNEPWNGDELVIEAKYSTIRVRYDDEKDVGFISNIKSLFGV